MNIRFRNAVALLSASALLFLSMSCGMLDSAKNAGENKRSTQKHEAAGEE